MRKGEDEGLSASTGFWSKDPNWVCARCFLVLLSQLDQISSSAGRLRGSSISVSALESFADTKLHPLSTTSFTSSSTSLEQRIPHHNIPTMARHPFVPLSIHVAAASAAGRPHIAATTSASPSPSPPPPQPAFAASHPSWPSLDPPISPHRPLPYAMNATSTSPITPPTNSTSSLRDPPPNTTPPGQRSQSPSAPRSGDEREDRRKGKGRERDEL